MKFCTLSIPTLSSSVSWDFCIGASGDRGFVWHLSSVPSFDGGNVYIAQNILAIITSIYDCSKP